MQSRYYDPEMGRFISADVFTSTGQGLLGNNMFAYCANSPICNADPTGYLRYDVATCSAADADWDRRSAAFLDPIYYQTEGFINGQGVFEFAQEAFGIGTYANNGCGSIAIYNAMQLLGKPASLGMITDEISNGNGFMLGGLLGATLGSIGNYFMAHNIAYTEYMSYSTMLQNLSEGDIIVFLVMNDVNNIFDGYHYMTAQYAGSKFIVYNISNRTTKPYPVYSLDPVYSNSGWFYGLVIGG